MHFILYSIAHVSVGLLLLLYFVLACRDLRASQMVLVVKNLPTNEETWVQSLGRKDLLEKGMTTHPSILAWRIPWTEEPGGLESIGLKRVGYNSSDLVYTQVSLREAGYIIR